MHKIKTLEAKLSLADARKKVEEQLKTKGWKDPSFGERILENKPYYFFNYTATIEKDGLVEKVEIWNSILDARSLKAENSFLKDFKIKALSEIEDKNALKPKADRSVLKRIAAVKIAEKFVTKKENIDIFEDTIFYCPFWKIKVKPSLQSKEFITFYVNAYTGETKSPDIDERQETLGEIIQETMHELKEPKKWWQYSKEIAEKTPKPKFKFTLKHDLLYLAIIVVLLIILYIVLII